jgi:hypothetical protein
VFEEDLETAKDSLKHAWNAEFRRDQTLVAFTISTRMDLCWHKTSAHALQDLFGKRKELPERI